MVIVGLLWPCCALFAAALNRLSPIYVDLKLAMLVSLISMSFIYCAHAIWTSHQSPLTSREIYSFAMEAEFQHHT